MKLILTVTEITTLARKSLGLPLDTEITIKPDPIQLSEPIQQLIDTIDALHWASIDKIQCIKTFRSVHQLISGSKTIISITAAKLSIENWPFTKNWIIEHGKLPTKFGDNQYNFTLGE
jgi:hypothetical protein